MLGSGLCAQPFTPPQAYDTLLLERAQGTFFADSFPTGFNTGWVNYDEDGQPQTCFTDDTYGWVVAQDAAESGDPAENYAFTSCSWLNNSGDVFPCGPKNRNWLITPPVHLNGAEARLNWKSLSRDGPSFVDGYVVMVSTTTNFPDAFTDTLFKAAQMIRQLSGPAFTSLDPADYLYTPNAYVHANTYTNDAYFFLNYDDVAMVEFLNGRLEPHSVDLSAYLGETIYIAFLHNSDCDFILQIDDIVITDDSVVGVQGPLAVHRFDLSPNPVSGPVRINFELVNPQPVQARLSDAFGRTLWTAHVEAVETQIIADFGQLPAGVYTLVLQAADGIITRKLIKE